MRRLPGRRSVATVVFSFTLPHQAVDESLAEARADCDARESLAVDLRSTILAVDRFMRSKKAWSFGAPSIAGLCLCHGATSSSPITKRAIAAKDPGDLEIDGASSSAGSAMDANSASLWGAGLSGISSGLSDASFCRSHVPASSLASAVQPSGHSETP